MDKEFLLKLDDAIENLYVENKVYKRGSPCQLASHW